MTAPDAPDPREADRARVAQQVEHHFTEALRLGGTLMNNAHFGSLEWKQAQWHLLQAQALQGVPLDVALRYVRERALHSLANVGAYGRRGGGAPL